MHNPPKVLVAWSGGMLGSDYIKSQNGVFDIIGLGSKELDIRDMRSVNETIGSIRPDFVLNCSAYTQVDDAEDVWRKENFEVNALGVYHLAKACRTIGCGFVTISTDYVFDGKKEGGYSPEDEPNPINAYGMAKYLWERLALEEYERTVIIRTSWLYGWGPDTKNFVNTIMRLGRTGSDLRIIADQYGAPTHTLDLCAMISQIFLSYNEYAGKIAHYSNETEDADGISWYSFAKEILRVAKINTSVIPISTEEYPTKANRPKNSKLKGWIPSGYWKNSVKRYIEIER